MGPRERLLVFLGVCLPVPVLAATGLSLPLPGTVERLATDLVPFTRSAQSDGGVASGSIVLTEAERRQARVRAVASRTVAPRPAPRALVKHQDDQAANGQQAPPRRQATRRDPVQQPIPPAPQPVAIPRLIPPEDDDAEQSHERRREPKPNPQPTPRPVATPRDEDESKRKQKPKKEPKAKEEHKSEKKPKRDEEDEQEEEGGESVEETP